MENIKIDYEDCTYIVDAFNLEETMTQKFMTADTNACVIRDFFSVFKPEIRDKIMNKVREEWNWNYDNERNRGENNENLFDNVLKNDDYDIEGYFSEWVVDAFIPSDLNSEWNHFSSIVNHEHWDEKSREDVIKDKLGSKYDEWDGKKIDLYTNIIEAVARKHFWDVALKYLNPVYVNNDYDFYINSIKEAVKEFKEYNNNLKEGLKK